MELCPCGTSYSFFNFPSMNQAPASDPESSWQVRHKGKTLKALMGPSAAFAGDHVELSDGGDDFASTVGSRRHRLDQIHLAVDPKPKDSFLLTPAREAIWRQWIALYNERQLAAGHAIAANSTTSASTNRKRTWSRNPAASTTPFMRAISPERCRCAASLPGRYRVRDYFNDRRLRRSLCGAHAQPPWHSRGSLLLEAIPV